MMDKILSEALGLDPEKDDISYYSWTNKYVDAIDDADVVIMDKSIYQVMRGAVLHEAGERRIQRERANADRGLSPKKVRKGYVLKSWRTRRAPGSSSTHVVAVLQTPWSVYDYQDPDKVKDIVAGDGLEVLFGDAYQDVLSVTYSGGRYWQAEIKLRRGAMVPKEILPYDNSQTDC